MEPAAELLAPAYAAVPARTPGMRAREATGEPRLAHAKLSESLYVRLVDVAAALSSRRGPVQERSPGALARTSMAFGPVDRAPWCPTMV